MILSYGPTIHVNKHAEKKKRFILPNYAMKDISEELLRVIKKCNNVMAELLCLCNT